MIGVYLITNNVNGKMYVGQSWDVSRRWKREKNLSGVNNHLSNAIRKYGRERFSFEILFEIKENLATQILLDEYETQAIKLLDLMNPLKGYNKREGGSGGKLSEETKQRCSNNSFWLGKKLPEEMIEKMRKAKKGKCGALASRYGAKLSDEQKQVLSKLKKGLYDGERNPMFGKNHTDETKRKISESKKRKNNESKT
jgi:group I intron endonuclease